jgi:hypothetical protein
MKCSKCMKLRLLALLEEKGNSAPSYLDKAIQEVPEAVAVESGRSVCHDCWVGMHWFRKAKIALLQKG